MAKLHGKIIRVLKKHLEDVDDFLTDLPGGRVSGVVVSPSFNRKQHAARQKQVMAALRESLSKSEFSKVGAIALLTPAEMTVKAF